MQLRERIEWMAEGKRDVIAEPQNAYVYVWRNKYLRGYTEHEIVSEFPTATFGQFGPTRFVRIPWEEFTKGK